MKKNKKSKNELISALWYGNHIGPATYGSCCECDTEPARGSGLCLKCAERQLGEIVGQTLAHNFHEAIKTTKAYENEIYDRDEE